jgi:peptidyl-prolyl cis-trans isomerase B (cyclophilin B)
VKNYRNGCVQGTLLLLVLALHGCGKSDDATSSTTASINGQNEATAGKSDGGAPAKSTSDPLHPVVVMDTSLGKVTIRLNKDKAPQTVENFLSYVTSKHFDQTIVHQVYKGQGILAGGYNLNGVEKPTRTAIRSEADNKAKNLRGTLSMVREPESMDSARSQFFINVADNTALDYKDRTPAGYGYCVFGEVTEGMDIIDSIANGPVHDTPQFERTPVQPVIVRTIQWMP